MKKLNVLVVSVIFALTACKDLAGSLSVKELISLKSDRRDVVQIQPGTYAGTLKVSSKRKINLELQLPQGKENFVFKTSQNLKDLKNGDRVQVASSTSGQPYDIDGVYTVNTTQSELQRANESCTYTTTEYRCRLVTTPHTCQIVRECNSQNPSQCADRQVCTGGETEQVCGNESVTHSGRQNVEFYYTTTTESVRLQLLSAQKAVTDFSGSDSSSSKHYTWQEPCR